MLLLNTLGWSELKAQSSAVETVQAGSKVFLEINAQQLQTELNSLFNATSGAANSDWNTVLTNGSNPGMDVNFSGYDAIGFGHINADGTVTADSLVLNKDASVTGMITVDSLKVTDVIQGQISSLSNLSSDNLTEGNTNLYMTSTERSLLSSMAATLDSLIAVIDALGSGSSPSEGATGCGDPVTYQGYDYATVQIGSQCWFAENLRNENYANGDPITEESVSLFGFDPVGVRGLYNGSTESLSTFGRLYNGYAVSDARSLCPSGWHVPSAVESTALLDFLGGDAVAGGKMKASASDEPAWDGTNSSGFSGLPGGYIFWDGQQGYSYYAGSDGYWWTSTPDGTTAGLFMMTSSSDEVTAYDDDQLNGLSVRCIQDAASTASVPAVVTDAASDVAEDAATLNGSITSDGGDAVTATGYRWGAMADLSDAQDLAGSGTSGSFTGSLTGLTAGMTYYFTAFATNAEGTAYGDTLSFETTAASAGFQSCGDTVTYQGYDYPTVAIGTLCWFKENLQAEQYNTGDAIPADLTNAEWAAATDPAAHKYSMDFGGMVYNQYAVLTGNLCPTGWHVSTHSDWTNLEEWVSPAEGFPMLIEAIKSSPTDTPSWNGTNTSGFSATTANQRNRFGFVLTTAPDQAYLWTSTEQSSAYGWYRRITSDGLWFNSTADKTEGFSVRCVLD